MGLQCHLMRSATLASMLVWPMVTSSSAVQGPRAAWAATRSLPQAGVVEGL